MRIGLFISDVSGAQTDVDELLANARAAEALGFTTGWVPHIPWSLDGLTALALAGQVTNRIELGTAVMPTYPRHPMAMAQQAMSTQAAADGRLVLGIGPSHPVVIENMFGLAYDRPARHTREYVEVLRAAFAGAGHVEYRGEFFSFSSMLTVPGSTPAPIMVAALAPRMLQLAGELTDGTITYWANERAIGEHIVPGITAAATAVGRPAPRVVVGLPGRGLRRRRRRARAGGEDLRHVPQHPDLPARPRTRWRRHDAHRRRRDRHRGGGRRRACGCTRTPAPPTCAPPRSGSVTTGRRRSAGPSSCWRRSDPTSDRLNPAPGGGP